MLAKIEVVLLGHSPVVFSLAFSSDRGRVLSGGDKTVKLWDTATGPPIRTFDVGRGGELLRMISGQSRERPHGPSQPETRHARLGAHPGGTP
jgi:WD40 repeat protein